jgi:hypothetical protein
MTGQFPPDAPIERIRRHLVGLRMPRALETLDHLVAIDEVELGECQDTVAVERGLEGEVEAGQRLDDTQPGHLQCCLDAAGLADGEFFGQQHLDRLDGAELTAFDLLDQVIEGFQSTR